MGDAMGVMQIANPHLLVPGAMEVVLLVLMDIVLPVVALVVEQEEV